MDMVVGCWETHPNSCEKAPKFEESHMQQQYLCPQLRQLRIAHQHTTSSVSVHPLAINQPIHMLTS